MKFGSIIFGNVIIILGYLTLAESKPFINPFNVAIKTEYAEEGNTLTFVYPKNSYRLNVNFNKEKINGHEFNIGQFFGHVARSIGKNLSFLNPFALSKSFQPTTTTTTESSFDFEPEDNDSISVSGSTTEHLESSTDGDVNGNGHSTIEEEVSTKNTSGGYSYDAKKYIPPQSTPKSEYLPPSTIYLPPKTIK